MSKNLDIPTMKHRLAQAEQELAEKVGHDMVNKHRLSTGNKPLLSAAPWPNVSSKPKMSTFGKTICVVELTK